MSVSESNRAARSGSFFVAAGIFLSRVSGLVRERVFAHYFGNSDAGDAFKAALKIPNFLQNLFGEGVLSASFIPTYARLLAQGDREAGRRVAWTVGGVLSLFVSVLVLAGTWATPHLIAAIAPGFQGEKKELTIQIVRILFPSTGILVLSAWCLGILNSHRRFFLSYSAPVLWNLAIIGAMLFFGGRHSMEELAIDAAWGLFLGSILQFAIQFPFALQCVRGIRAARPEDRTYVLDIQRSFFPIVIGRGVVQVSAYVDNMIASLLPTGAVSAIAYAQTLYLLPVSLFGMSVSAAELPELSSVGDGGDGAKAELRSRLESALSRISFFVIPSVVAFALLGDVVSGAVFQTGEFLREDSLLVWGILVGASVALLPTTSGRLISSAFYALRDTKTPLQASLARVTLSILLGLFAALHMPALLGLPEIYGTVGLSLASGIAGWIEYALLRRKLEKRIGKIVTRTPARKRAWIAAVIAGGAAFALKTAIDIESRSPIGVAFWVLGLFGGLYFLVGAFLGISEAKKVAARFGIRSR